MAEAGGTSTQSGIFYQNSVAARRLIDLLSLNKVPPRERAIDIRVEAPAHVDDIVIRYADGHRDWIQAKEELRSSGDAWHSLWQSFASQLLSDEFGAEDRLVLVLGTRSNLASDLRQLCERAATAIDRAELQSRLGQAQARLLTSIETSLPSGLTAIEMLQRTNVEVMNLDDIEADLSRQRLGAGFSIPTNLYSSLRDIAGSGARNRALFLAAPLRWRLSREFGIELSEPLDWGLPAYRNTVERLAVLEIPGTGISAPVDDLFVWPMAYKFERGSTRDFEDELPQWNVERVKDRIDMRFFAEEELRQCVIVAGPGYGKSALLQAIQARLIRSPIVPVLVSLGSFGASDLGVLEYVSSEINRSFDVKVDWHRLAEQGLIAILFDGLDEIPLDQRRSVLKRIEMLSARHPLLPWMLTVRDPSVVSGPANAQMLELLPLENADIARFTEAMKKKLPSLEYRAVMSALDAHPDLARLARIPLFLSMMLAGWRHDRPLPQSRSDLIETYLQTLFSPAGHKLDQITGIDAEVLRSVAEAIAFESIDRHEIGATSRQATQLASRLSALPADLILECLLRGGVLKRQSAVRLQFPYPIVQEYLAACYLVRTAPHAVAARIGDAIKRPWAQVIQFAIELLPESSSVVSQMLTIPDDAFSTGLRLVGRCVVNGAKVNSELRAEIGRRLAELWGESTYTTRERVGQLIVDGFSQPLHPAVKQRLAHRWLIGSGAGKIVATAGDPALSLEVLNSLLQGRLDGYLSLRELRLPFSNIGDDVVKLVYQRAQRKDITLEELENLADFLSLLDHTKLSPGIALDLALDVLMPDSLRMTAFSINPSPLDRRAWELVERSFQSTNYKERWATLKIIARGDNVEDIVLGYLMREDIPMEYRISLVRSLPSVLPDDARRRKFISSSARDTKLPTTLGDMMKVYLSRDGDRSAFEDLVNRLTSLPEILVGATLCSLNYWPDLELGLRALNATKQLYENKSSSSQVARLAQNAYFGLRYLFDKTGFDGGQLHDAPLHPAAPAWASLIDSWAKNQEASPIQRLKLLLVSVRLGGQAALNDVESIVFSIQDPDDKIYDDDEHGYTLRDAMDELRVKTRPIPIDLAERFVRSNRPNLAYAGVAAIAARADQAALDRLLDLHNNLTKKDRSEIADAIERLSGRLGTTIHRTGTKFTKSEMASP